MYFCNLFFSFDMQHEIYYSNLFLLPISGTIHSEIRVSRSEYVQKIRDCSKYLVDERIQFEHPCWEISLTFLGLLRKTWTVCEWFSGFQRMLQKTDEITEICFYIYKNWGRFRQNSVVFLEKKELFFLLKKLLIFTSILWESHKIWRNLPLSVDINNLLDSSSNFEYLLWFFFHCTEVRFASFLSGGFTTLAVINPKERKLAKLTSVLCACLVKKTTIRYSKFDTFKLMSCRRHYLVMSNLRGRKNSSNFGDLLRKPFV